MWLLCTDKPFKNAQLIYPTQQKDVSKIVESAKADKNVRKVIIFGSSVSNRCNPWSDIDVYYDIEEKKRLPFCDSRNPLDRWTNYSVDDELLEEILSTGVTVYERDVAG